MEGLRMSYCRFCAEQKPLNCLLNLEVDLTLLKEVEMKLIYLNIKNIDFSQQNSLPKTICIACYNDLFPTEQLFQKLQHSQIKLSKLFSPNRINKHTSADDCESSDFTDEEMPVETVLGPAGYSSCAMRRTAEIPNIPHQMAPTNAFCQDPLQVINQVPAVPTSCPENKLSKEVIDNPENYSDGKNFRKDDSWDGYQWICQHCRDEFKDLNLLREHLMTMHKVCNGFYCVDCLEVVNNFNTFVKHVRVHRKKLKFYCQYCNIKLDCQDHAVLHTKQHEEKQKLCKKCGQAFLTDTLLKHHKDTYKASKLKSDRISTKAPDPSVLPLTKSKIKRIKNKSWDGYKCVCQLCDEAFTDLNALRSHAKDTHNTCFSIKCMDCPMRLDSFNLFVMHVRQHRPYLKRYCQYCNYDFKAGDPDSIHLAQHFISVQKICHGCGDILPNKAELHKHMVLYNPKVTRPKDKGKDQLTAEDLTCEVCQKVAKSLAGLRAHKQLHTDKKPSMTCDICGKVYTVKSNYATHMYTHKKQKTEMCEICQKCFRNPSQLRAHVRTHTDLKPFTCPICSKSFRVKKQMLNHSLVHSDTMRFQCQFCDKAFKHKTNWATHQHQHTGARPYRCTECDMGFASWSNCNKHMIRRHGVTLAKTKLTPLGRLPINQRTGETSMLDNFEAKRAWTEKILVAPPKKKGKCPTSSNDGS